MMNKTLFIIVLSIITSVCYGKEKDYMPIVNGIYDYVNRNPNARSTEWGGYHIFSRKQEHLLNGGAQTSEGQTLLYNFLALYSQLTGESKARDSALQYIRKYMIPCDELYINRNFNKPVCDIYLLHWLIDVSGTGPGELVYGKNVLYSRYSTPPRKCFINPNDFYFASAPDADQWFVLGLHWANEDKIAQRLTQTLIKNGLTNSNDFSEGIKKYNNIMKFSLQWDNNGRIKWEGPCYTGYQNPACYYLSGRSDIATDIITFLEDAQKIYDEQDGIRNNNIGPFMPVYVQHIQYGKTGWTWFGPDENTHWGQFFYRTFNYLSYYYYLSGDKQALKICLNVVNWLTARKKENGNSFLIPTLLQKNSEKVSSYAYDTGAHALVARGLIYLAAKTGEVKYREMAEALLDDMIENHMVKDKSKPYCGVFVDGTPEEDIHGYDIWESGISFCEYILKFQLNNKL